MNELQDIKRIPIGSLERNGSFRFLSAKIIILFVYSLWNETNEYLSSFAIAHERIILPDKSQPIYFPILTLMIYILPYDLGLLWTFFSTCMKVTEAETDFTIQKQNTWSNRIYGWPFIYFNHDILYFHNYSTLAEFVYQAFSTSTSFIFKVTLTCQWNVDFIDDNNRSNSLMNFKSAMIKNYQKYVRVARFVNKYIFAWIDFESNHLYVIHNQTDSFLKFKWINTCNAFLNNSFICRLF